MIIDHNDRAYRNAWKNAGRNKHNGAYYYSKEIVKYFIPVVKTDRNWVTIRAGEKCLDHSIVFIHNNLHPERYDFLKRYKDLVLVCGVPETCEKVKHLGVPIYLPLSVDVQEVARYRRDDRKGTAFAGRKSKRKGKRMEGIPCIESMDRDTFLRNLARFENVYAVGRTAIEAKILGCTVLPYDDRFPDPSVWKVLDSREAAKILQEKLKEVDNV